jgi:hypothetical protein
VEIKRFRYPIRKPVLKTVWPLGVISSPVFPGFAGSSGKWVGFV